MLALFSLDATINYAFSENYYLFIVFSLQHIEISIKMNKRRDLLEFFM